MKCEDGMGKKKNGGEKWRRVTPHALVWLHRASVDLGGKLARGFSKQDYCTRVK